MLELLEHATERGWSRRRACRVLGLDERRARRWPRSKACGLPAIRATLRSADRLADAIA